MQFTAIRSLLSFSGAYRCFQSIMGAHQGRIKIVRDYVQPKKGDAVLDIGCGPGDILNYLPDVSYWGFDISHKYIQAARSRFGARGNFYCREFDEADIALLPAFDVVLLSGVLHHLDDNDARHMLSLAQRALKPTGRLVTMDPCLVSRQSRIARHLIKLDRGHYVRDEAGYRALAESKFYHLSVDVSHTAWIPYTRCYMKCTRT